MSNKRVGIIITLIVLFVFIGVLVFTSFIESFLGKTGEMIALIIIAIILLAMLYVTNRRE